MRKEYLTHQSLQTLLTELEAPPIETTSDLVPQFVPAGTVKLIW